MDSGRSLKYILFFMIVALYLDFCIGVKISMDPTRFTGKDGNTIKIACNLDEAEAAAKSMLMLKIAKQGEKAIAILYPNNTITRRKGNAGDYIVEGKISEPLINSYMKMDIKDPDMDDSGAYTCSLFYVDESGIMTEDKATSFLTVDDPELGRLKDQVKDLISQIKILKSQKIKATPIIAFSATNDKEHIYAMGQHNIVFKDIITSMGHGYNPQTGIFTAPIHGLYNFELVLKTQCKSCEFRVHLMASNKVVFKLQMGNVYDQHQNSGSAVVPLSKGERVRCYTEYVSQTIHLPPARLNVFSGYLIHVI